MVLLQSMTLSFDVVLNACKLGITAAIILGLLGYYIGKELEKSSKKGKKSSSLKKNSELLIDDVLNEDLDDIINGENNSVSNNEQT
jgi:hypothetical protein